MKPAIIFFDIDGTIVTFDGRIPASAARAVSRARENGHICVVNSGRPFSHILPSVKAIGFDGYICSCGQHIIFKGEEFSVPPLPPGVAAKMRELVRRTGCEAVYESERGIYFDHTRPMRREIKQTFEDFTARGFDTMADIDREWFDFDKFCVWYSDESARREITEGVSPGFQAIDRGGGLLEMVRRGCSKRTGAELIMRLCSASRADCFAIGDSTNDLPMLECVSHGIAMGGAPDAVKNAAEFVTDDIDRDGLEKALRHYGLI